MLSILPVSYQDKAPVMPLGRQSAGLTFSTYDAVIRSDMPTSYFPLSRSMRKDWDVDLAHSDRKGVYYNTKTTLMPNGDKASVFNGRNSYFEIPDSADLSVTGSGILTIEAWMRPDALVFQKDEGSGYVHWMGKGVLPNQMEWATRMYSADNTEGRENRISGYAFNPEGGRGIGSYTQQSVDAGDWIHYVFVINTTPDDPSNPGYTKIYRDGSNLGAKTPWDDMDSLLEYWPTPDTPHLITPVDGSAPLRVGTRDFRSFFEGAVGKVAIYNYELSPDQIQRHYDAMWHPL